jgi:hypothetical protein
MSPCARTSVDEAEDRGVDSVPRTTRAQLAAREVEPVAHIALL